MATSTPSCMLEATTYSPPKCSSVQRSSSSADASANSVAPRSASSINSFSVITSLIDGLRSSRKRSSQTRSRKHSSKIRLVCSYRPRSETLAVLALFHEVAHHTLDVVAQLAGQHLVLAQLAAESAVQTQASAQVDLEALDGVIAVVHHLALESDVGDLDAGARVGAAVDVDGDRHVELRVDVLEPLLQLGHQHLSPVTGLGERQLAVLDAGAGHQVLAPVRRPRRQSQRVQTCD